MAEGNHDGSSDWCTIESDPGVFTSLIESFGVRNVEVTELWSLDDDSLASLVRPMDGVDDASVHGLIFLFKWQKEGTGAAANNNNNNNSNSNATAEDDATPETGTGTAPLTGDDVPPNLFFAHQVVTNACATQAILSVLFNAPRSIPHPESDDDTTNANTNVNAAIDDHSGRHLLLGPLLTSFRAFSRHFPPSLLGEAIGSSEEIRAAHNSFGRADDAFLHDPTSRRRRDRREGEDEDVFHFVAFVPHGEDGCLYELDGLKAGPVRVGRYRDGGDGAENRNSQTESNSAYAKETLTWLHLAKTAIQTRLSHYPPAEIKFNLLAVTQDRRTYLSSHLDSLVAMGLEESDPAMLHVREELLAEENKRELWQVENERRRWNYLPFCVELLRSLAGSGKLEELVEGVRGRVREREERKKKNHVRE
mmetsp:Transcript_13845/g.25946  ORF Transcript_13845/g.25946 Transcript_13845/m.25946 type:complete len:421 (+) Transcript_13845:111-1373(+)